jgi:altronate dehydratase large subunit
MQPADSETTASDGSIIKIRRYTEMEFWGYKRSDGSVGVRNYVVIIPAGRCANELAIRIAEGAGSKVIALTHNHGCAYLPPDRQTVLRAMAGLGQNPNVAAVLVVGIGCEGTPARTIADGIAPSKKPLDVLTLETDGNYQAVLDKGIAIVKKMLTDASALRREPFDLGYLTLGLKCGGSSAFSAIGCNPVAGWAADAVVAAGGTAIFSETAEIIGAEHVLAKRAFDEKTAQRIYDVANRMRDRMKNAGVDITTAEPAPGNIKEGLTTMEEKSLGAIAKGGTSPLQGVLEWAERPRGKGLYFMDGSANSPQVFVGFAAAGAQLTTFNLGGGLPTSFRRAPAACGGGLPILPIVKIVTTPRNLEEQDYCDIFLDGVIGGQESIPQAGQRLLEELTAVASGKPSKMEMFPPYQEMIEFYSLYPTI